MQGWGQFPLIHLRQFFFWGGGGVGRGCKQWRIPSSCRSNAEAEGKLGWYMGHMAERDDLWKSCHRQSRCSCGETLLIRFKVEPHPTISHPWAEKCTPWFSEFEMEPRKHTPGSLKKKKNPIRSLFLSKRRGRGAAQLMCGWEKSCRAKVGRRWHNPTVGMYYYLCCFQCSSYTFQSENWMRI